MMEQELSTNFSKTSLQAKCISMETKIFLLVFSLVPRGEEKFFNLCRQRMKI
jgi:hypothetical protein